MDIRDYFNQLVQVVIDRPLGSLHPKHGFVYTLNYGFIPNTMSGDGQEIDAYIIGEFEPLNTFEGYVVAIIYRKNDVEQKLVVCKEKNRYSKQQIEVLVEFVERYFDHYIVVEK